jgi:hypothetical protein
MMTPVKEKGKRRTIAFVISSPGLRQNRTFPEWKREGLPPTPYTSHPTPHTGAISFEEVSLSPAQAKITPVDLFIHSTNTDQVSTCWCLGYRDERAQQTKPCPHGATFR